MSIANNIDYGGAFSLPCAAGAAPSELEVMLMSTVRRCHRAAKVSSKEGKGGLKSMSRVSTKLLSEHSAGLAKHKLSPMNNVT